MRILTKAGSGIGLVVGAALLIVANSNGDTPGAQAPSIEASYSVLRTPPVQLTDRAADRARSMADRLATGTPPTTLNPTLAWPLRRVGAQTTYLLANDDVACLLGDGPQRYYLCTPASVATSKSTAMLNVGWDGKDSDVEALLPDSAAAARAVGPAGEETPLEISNNLATGSVSGAVPL